MVTMFVRHKVNDYESWKSAYDEVGTLRRNVGVTGASVYRDTQNPDFVIITHQFNNLDTANGFAGSPELKAAMAKAGVAGPPEFWFGEEIEHTES